MVIHPSEAMIGLYLDGQTSESEDAAIRAHLDSCPQCEQYLARELDRRDAALAANRPPVAPPRVLRRLANLALGPSAADANRFPQVDGYEVEALIGRGGMGVVHRARHADFGTVALKTIIEGEFADAAQIARFRREMEEAKTISVRAGQPGQPRPASVTVFEVGESRGLLFLSMELAVGGSARGRLADLAEQPEQAARLVRGVAEELAVMHGDSGSKPAADARVHRDIKPDNILLQPHPGAEPDLLGEYALADLDPLLSDFGLVRPIEPTDPTSTTQSPFGTPAYTAPELLAGARATRHSDIYALGASLYEMLCGHPPFAERRQSPRALLTRITAGHPPRPSGGSGAIPTDLETICLRCLEKNPKRRYATATALADDLRRFERGEPILARPPGLIRRAWRKVEQNRAVAVAFTVLGLLLASVALVAVYLAQRVEFTQFRADTDRDRAHQATVAAARAAARVGAWPEAFPGFDAAIRDGFDDQTSLRVERLYGYLGTNDRARLAGELADLDNRPDLGPLRPHVDLVRGVDLMCDPSQRAEGRARVRRALEHRDQLRLSPADPEFAAALVAERPVDVVAHLRAALRLDRLHIPAQGSLVVALLATGHTGEARRQADEMRDLFPRATQPPFLLAAIELVVGDHAAMHRALDAMARVATPADQPAITRLRAYLDDLADAVRLINRVKPTSGLGWIDTLRLAADAKRLRDAYSAATGPFTFPIPTVGLLFDQFGRLVDAYRASRHTGSDDDYRRLLALSEPSPEALFLAMAAGNRLTHIAGALNQTDMAPARGYLTEVGNLASAAADGPTLLPMSPIRYQCRILAAIADVAQLKITPDPGPVPSARLRDNLHRLVVDGRANPSDRRQGFGLIGQILMVPMTAAQAAEWKVGDDAGRAAFAERRRLLFGFVRFLVDDWLQDEPGDEAAKKLRGELDRQAAESGLIP